MEFIDLLTLGVGCITFYEAKRRIDLLTPAKDLSKKIEGKCEVAVQDNCISYRILSSPMNAEKWKLGVGATINERSFVLFLLIVLILAVIGSLLTLVTSYPGLAFLLIALVFSYAFHSAPDPLTIKELCLGIVISQEPEDLYGHDSRILSWTLKEYSSWP